MLSKNYISTNEVAKILGVSRQAVLKKIDAGEIRAEKIGRNFVVAKKDILEIAGHILGETRKQEIEASLEKTLKDYGEAIKKLGEE
ncbi:MAG: hypothetical protein UT29_C0004G0007 [Candidatus Yanofskybacteria bacterium GW2011_GWA1_39_13]|uniref:Helix-turn-helix domain-containing protein n=1 Tax=Yanofskybacteria sp. (strain GW2011_GWA1_39_13) TaxID=1619019 RepID=A0A0G0ME18_YANXG|nr:MAG: hypothetical protein UT29_C0004G0007 [Candidatus Yanofskybacteria bacterium GW2011_GWA1_39_13]